MGYLYILPLRQPARRCVYTESVYCEPRELSPYATSEDSDKDSLGSSDLAAAGRQRGPPKDWRVRQSIPLPPKPDEDGPGQGLRTSPPPPYYPTRPLPPPVPAPRPHGYVNDPESAGACYFQPLSDDEARLVGVRTSAEAAVDNAGFEAAEENAYLEGRPDGGEAIEMRDLAVTGPRDRFAPEDLSAPNGNRGAPTTVYAIRRESPSSDLVT